MATAPQFNRLLEDCREMAISHLRPLMDRMFENADVALLGFAESAESNMAQSVFFEAMAEVRRKRSAIEKLFYVEIERSFSEFPRKPDATVEAEETDNPFGGLSLVDREEMETSVAMLNASRKLGTRMMDKVFGLKQRLAILNNGNSIEENHIPAGPAWLGFAYQRAIEQLELENKVRLVFIVLYEKYVLSRIDTLFDEFNKRLIEAGILPHLRYEIRKQPGSIEIVQTTSNGAPEESTDTDPVYEPDQSASELGDELFGRICDLIAVRRSAPRPGQGSPPGAGHGGVYAGGGANGPGGSHGGQYAGGGGNGPGGGYGGDGAGGTSGPGAPGQGGAASGDTGAPITGPGSVLVGEISRLQSVAQSGSTRMSSSEFIENIEIDENLVERLQSTLSAERDKIFGNVDRRKLPAADTNVIELVGMLFEYMLLEENLPNSVKALLSRLHTPLLKVAVLDRHFFTQAQHPARKLLNDMAAAGRRWVEETNIERGIFPKMKEIVDRLLVEFEEDVGIFDALLKEFSNSVTELQQRARLVEHRNAEAAEGQDRLQAARARARQELTSLCTGKAVVQAGRDFLQRLWADKLTFILLRNPEGDGCESWHEAVSLAQRMIESLQPPASESARQERSQALAGLQQELREQVRAMQQSGKEKLLNTLFNVQADALKQVVPEQAGQAAPEPPAVEAQATEPDASGNSDAAPLTPAQQDTVARLKGIPFGTWFEFIEESRLPRRLKLSWRSTITEKFMFVDQMGVKAAVISMRDLAECLIDGKARVIAEEKKPFVDRALHAIHRMLDHGTGQKARA
jgi:hypothetical protein